MRKVIKLQVDHGRARRGAGAAVADSGDASSLERAQLRMLAVGSFGAVLLLLALQLVAR